MLIPFYNLILNFIFLIAPSSLRGLAQCANNSELAKARHIQDRQGRAGASPLQAQDLQPAWGE
jgi:hypothetical protein